MKAMFRVLPIILALLLLVLSSAGALNAAAYYVGQWVGFGTVSSTSSRTVASGVTYDNTIVKGSSGGNQKLQTITFNPATSNYMPLVYSQYSGYGATTINSAKAAEAIGYDVKGGVNASFFSFTGSSCNTYDGVNISDGKILQGCNSNGAAWVLAFNSDGTSALAYSKVAYSLVAKNGAWSAPLESINICPETTYTGIYYYDEFCGSNTDTKAAGVEIVFEKQNGTQLIVGGTLVGKVVAVRSSVSSGGSIGPNRFVLYASNSSSYASYLRGLTVGDTVAISAKETMTGAKTVMENCSSAFVTYGYHIVSGGANVTANDGLGESFNTARAQRSGIGVKADGTLVIVASTGRTTSYSGMTVYELANYLISQGCVTAINLDGGGSTQMTVENASGSLESVLSSSRRVANSILVVARPAISASDRSTLLSLIEQASNLQNGYVLSGDTAALSAALTYGNTVYNSSKSMPGDYTKAIMRLREAIAGVNIVGYRTGIYRLNAVSSLLNDASASASAITLLPAGKTFTVTQTSGNYGYTKILDSYGWVDLTKATYIGAAANTAATINAPSVAYKGQSITVSWPAVNGAAAYTYRVIELAGEPDPSSTNESAGARVLAEAVTTDALSVTVPASAHTDGKYLKVAVCVEYPAGSAWSTAYITTSELPFTDVAPNYWGYEAIKHCYQNGYFAGTTGTTFEPNGTVSRASLAVVIYRMAGSPELDPTTSIRFTDIPENAWYRDAVAWCYSQGIVTGISSTVFSPDSLISREQAACILYRFAGAMGYDTEVKDERVLDSFDDAASVSSYAKTAMVWAVENGILSGNGNNLLPQGSATRVQLAAMLYRFDIAFTK